MSMTRAIAALLGIAVCASCAARMIPSAPTSTAAGVRFVLVHAGARSVAVAGSFNGWSAISHPLSRHKAAGRWSAVVPLPPGEHLFMYVVDGTEWVTPPAADDYMDDGFGSRNGVVWVAPRESKR